MVYMLSKVKESKQAINDGTTEEAEEAEEAQETEARTMYNHDYSYHYYLRGML